jgi:dynein heavy chain
MKSLLRMAGKLLRQASSDTSEQKVLKNALKNFNLPRIIINDKPIFEMLCEDLFPDMVVVHTMDKRFMATAQEILNDPVMINKYGLEYRDENEFIKICVQLTEILEVRHCMFVIGPAGSGKSAVIRTLGATWNALNNESRLEYLNPKAITRFELYGYVDPKTGWKNGVLSSIMRNMSKNLNKYTDDVVNK